MPKPAKETTKQKAFLMRLDGNTFTDIGKKLKVCSQTVSRWENGWIDGRGRRYTGWKQDLEQMRDEIDREMLNKGLMLKRKRLQTLEEIAEMAIEKMKEQFPNITAKTATDMKALTSEIRELLKQIAIEKGEYRQGDQTLDAVKADITLTEMQERYQNAYRPDKEDTD